MILRSLQKLSNCDSFKLYQFINVPCSYTLIIYGLGGCFQYSPEVFIVSVYRLYAIVIELSRSVTTQTVFTSITKEFVIVKPRKLSISSKDVF